MVLYFLRGTLPWRKIKGSTTTETWDLIRDKKLETETLLTVGLPQEFDIFYKYSRGLEFDDLPDYEGLRELFRGLAAQHGIEYDWVFDWSVPKPGHAKSDSTSSLSAGGPLRKRKRNCRSCSACQAAAAAEEAAETGSSSTRRR